MIVRLGDVVCDPVMTGINGGACSDSAGNLLKPDGTIASAAELQGGCPPGYVLHPTAAVCIPASSPAAAGGPAAPPSGTPGVTGQLAWVAAAAVIVYLIIRR